MSVLNKKSIDWELVERGYRAGIKTLRQIGEENRISHTAVQKRAKQFGWSRAKAIVVASADRSVSFGEVVDELDASGFVYGIYFDSGGKRYFKIGMARSPMLRLEAHQVSTPFEVRIGIAYFVKSMRHEERALHDAFAEKQIRGEWYALDDADIDFMASRARLV